MKCYFTYRHVISLLIVSSLSAFISEMSFNYRYHCHTCKMIDGVGVCTICAKVCHKDHDVTYAKFGSFFCDCGAKECGSCQVINFW